MIDLKMGLKTKEFLELILEGIADYASMEIIIIDDVRMVSHHLVLLDEVADTFEFGYFSVSEFFYPDMQRDKYYDEISRDFGPEGIWRHISPLCVFKSR